jgi:hypothetical protein
MVEHPAARALTGYLLVRGEGFIKLRTLGQSRSDGRGPDEDVSDAADSHGKIPEWSLPPVGSSPRPRC